MHRVWLLALALTLAGCTAPDDPDAGDLPPGVPPGDAPDDGTDGSGGDGDGSGGGGDGGGSGFAPQTHHAEADGAGGDLHGGGDLSQCAQGFCVHVWAENVGDATYHVSSVCVSPWSDRMERDGEPVAHREPLAHCLAFGTHPFRPGDRMDANLTWDARVWDDAGGRYEPAPEGAYVWTVSFQAYERADGGDAHVLDLAFPLIVGET